MKDWENPVAGTLFGKETMPKIIRCNPKTGSTWLSVALTQDHVIALHDAINGCYHLDDYREKIEAFEYYYDQVIDVTTAPMWIAEQLGEVVWEQNESIFHPGDFYKTIETVLDIAVACDHGEGIDIVRLDSLKDIRISSRPEDVDIEAGVALWNSLAGMV